MSKTKDGKKTSTLRNLIPVAAFLISLTLVWAAAAGKGPSPAAPGLDERTSHMNGTAETPIFDFGEGSEAWRNIDDVVMGGVSRSRMSVDGGIAVFEGVVSLENNGGFASVRSRPSGHDLSGYDGILVRLRGDGKVYALRLRTTATFDGVSYQATIETKKDTSMEVRLPFSGFRPVFRGRRVPDSPELDPARVKSFGFLIAGKQTGPFRLEVESIGVYRDRAEPGTGAGSGTRG
jgi:monofunctional biosynthetic peptidoglycan transglycosylase